MTIRIKFLLEKFLEFYPSQMHNIYSLYLLFLPNNLLFLFIKSKVDIYINLQIINHKIMFKYYPFTSSYKFSPNWN